MLVKSHADKHARDPGLVHHHKSLWPMSKVQKKRLHYENKKKQKEEVFKPKKPVALPSSFSLVGRVPSIYDQLDIGSCTANALSLAFRIECPDKVFQPSRLFIYAMERELEERVLSDSGADAVDGMRVMSSTGVCPENLWPYNTANVNVPPPQSAIAGASKHKIGGCKVIDDPTPQSLLNDIKHTLVSGYPVLMAFIVYPSFMSSYVSTTGNATLPKPGEEPDGGHEVLIVGYDDKAQHFIVANSWGPQWGMRPPGAATRGYFTMPYAYATNKDLTVQFAMFSQAQ